MSNTLSLHDALPISKTTAKDVADDLVSKLGKGPFAGVFFFTSGDSDLSEIGKVLSVSYPDTPLIGCTSAGVIDLAGYNKSSVSAFALPESHFSVSNEILKPISSLNMPLWQEQTYSAIERVKEDGVNTLPDNTFALLLVDGLSLAEETVLSAIYPVLGDIPLFGGSAGDDLKFDETLIYCNGEIYQDAAALILVNTKCSFTVFRTQHFVETPRKMVITEADPQSRIVKEINASPATEEYARLVGVEMNELSPQTFAKHPVMVRVGGSYYVRSIQRPEGADGLKFFCAIDEGLVLTLAEGKDLVANLEDTLEDVQKQVGDPELIIGCDCVFRKLELELKDKNKFQQVSDLLKDNNVIGFNTYGEQFAGMHVNQTFTGVAIGWSND